MNSFFVLVGRELRSITREKTIILAIVIQLLIASFSSVIVTGLMAFYDPDSIGRNAGGAITIGVVDDSGGPLTVILKERQLNVKRMGRITQAEEAFRSGEVDTVMIVPKGDGVITNMQLLLPEQDSKSTVILMILKEPLKDYENFLRSRNGVTMKYTEVRLRPDTSYEFLYSLILPILMFFPALLAGSIVIDTVSEELENKTLDTLRTAPVSLHQILGAKVFAAVVTVVIQCVAWIVLLRLNNLEIQNLGLVLLLSLAVGTLVTVGAALVSLYFKDRERAQFTYSMVLVAAVGLSYLFGSSPLSLIAGLATGGSQAGPLDLALYAAPLLLLGAAFFRWADRLLAVQSLH
ncbi:MAG: ABC transporter permease [Dehalococcoidales bacterium]